MHVAENIQHCRRKTRQNCSRCSKLQLSWFPCLQPYCILDILASQKILSA